MTEHRSTKRQIGMGMLVAGAILAIPGASNLISGDASSGAGLLVIPVLLIAGALAMRSETPRIPLIVGTVVAVALVGASITVKGSTETDPVEPPSKARVALLGTPPSAPRPVQGETSWLPARERISPTAQIAYDEYMASYGVFQHAQAEADKADDAYRRAIKDYSETKKRYQQGAESYSVVSRAYADLQDARDAVTEARTSLGELSGQVVQARMALLDMLD